MPTLATPEPDTPAARWLADALGATPRRYRASLLPASLEEARATGPSTALAVAIEQAREAVAAGSAPAEPVRLLFLASLQDLIVEALPSDAAFQAMVLRHRSPVVREYASLSAHADADRRTVRATVNALAHPEKVDRRAPGEVKDALRALQAASGAEDWTRVAEIASRLAAAEDVAEPALDRGLHRLQADAALTRLQRLAELTGEASVDRYRALWAHRGPSPGTEEAAARGAGAQQRGDAVEALAAEAIRALADRMNTIDRSDTDTDTDGRGAAAEEQALWRVATSLRVPPSFPGDAQRAKSEWDVALLRWHKASSAWDLCLLVEAKASADAATTDLPRLLRGLRLLAGADADAIYAFTSDDGDMPLRGASLRALPIDEDELDRAVLYCSDAAVDPSPRLLNAASRMQLLSADASLDGAIRLEDGQAVDAAMLDPVWRQLLEARSFAAVLRQYATLRRVRELMVHPDDLLRAVADSTALPADPDFSKNLIP